MRVRTSLPGLARFAAAAVVLVAATGCVSIPEGSSVREGRAVSAQDQQPLSRNQPDGPRPGAGRKEIATGYLNAMLAFPPAPDVVRQFLTPDASADWNPEDGLVVYAESDQPRLTEKAETVSFSARGVGSLDDRGTWTTARGDDRQINMDFKMGRVNGEWRLVNPLPGSYVDEDYFADYYDPFSLYFFDPSNTILVPDPVHMLLGDSLATALVKDLLRGPTAGIEGAVTSSIPTTATVDVAVSISSTGVAEVPLSEEILQLSPDDRRYFATQLVWTLKQVPDVRAVTVTVDGQRIDLGGSSVVDTESFTGFDPAGFAASRQLYGLSGQGLVSVSKVDTTTVPGPLLRASRDARSAAVEVDATQAAVVSADGTTVSVGGINTADTGTSVWYRRGQDVVKPSWDIHEVLWVADNRRDGGHLYTATDAGTREVKAPGIDGRQIDSIAVSRDGVRLAAVVGRGKDRELLIAVIDRDPADPKTVVSLRRAHLVRTVGGSTGGISSAAWISPTSIAALVDDAGGPPEPTEIRIDGAPVASPFPGFVPIKPVALAAGPNEDTPTAISDAQGVLYEVTATAGWIPFGGGAAIRAPFYPG
jgi:hypothetical protein